MLKKEKVLSVRIRDVKLSIRTLTPDLAVAFSGLVDGEYENIEAENPKLIIDAGAYIGTASIAFATKYPAARVIALEPEQSNYELLIENTQNYPNIFPINVALSHEMGSLPLFDSAEKWGFSLVAQDPSLSGSVRSTVKCVNVPFLLSKYSSNQIDILKVDIEGAEKVLFENSADWISSIGQIVVELHDRHVSGCTAAFQDATAGFTVVGLDGEKFLATNNCF